MTGMLRGRSAAKKDAFAEAMYAAQQLPLEAQIELVEALLRRFRGALEGGRFEGPGESELQPLRGMNESELRVLADAVFAPERQEELSALLRKNREESLKEDDQQRLDILLDEADRLALLKARALYTLKLRQAAGEV